MLHTFLEKWVMVLSANYLKIKAQSSQVQAFSVLQLTAYSLPLTAHRATSNLGLAAE